MKKLMNAVDEKAVEKPVEVQEGARPTYLLDREQTTSAKVLTNMLKQKRYLIHFNC
jgi:ribosome biogenesis protein NSA2